MNNIKKQSITLKFLTTSFIVAINLIAPSLHSTPSSYLDPWMYLGYGYDYPDPTFPLDNWDGYYKESRVPWIWIIYIYHKIFSINFAFFLAISIMIITFFCLVRLVPQKNSLVFHLLATSAVVSPLYFSSGGFLYHNSAINLLIVIFLSFILKPLQNWYFTNLITISSLITALIINPLTICIFLPLILVFYKKIFSKKISYYLQLFYIFFLVEQIILFFGLLNELNGRPFKFWAAQLNLFFADRKLVESFWDPISLSLITNNFFNFFISVSIIFSIILLFFKVNIYINFSYIISYILFVFLHFSGIPIFNSEYMVNPLTFFAIVVAFSNSFNLYFMQQNIKLFYISIFYPLTILIDININIFLVFSLILLASIGVKGTFFFTQNIKIIPVLILSCCFLIAPPQGPFLLNNRCEYQQKYLETSLTLLANIRDNIGKTLRVAVWGDPDQKIDFYCLENLPLSDFANTQAQMGLYYMSPPFPQKSYLSEEFDFGIRNFSTPGDTIILFLNTLEISEILESLPVEPQSIEFIDIPYSRNGQMVRLQF